jgi:hypothetical protein
MSNLIRSHANLWAYSGETLLESVGSAKKRRSALLSRDNSSCGAAWFFTAKESA